MRWSGGAVGQLARRRAASHWRRSLRRSSSEVPPQMPESWLVDRANSRQGWRASHVGAHGLGVVDLLDGGTGGADGEEQVGVGVTAGGLVAPVIGRRRQGQRAGRGEGHGASTDRAHESGGTGSGREAVHMPPRRVYSASRGWDGGNVPACQGEGKGLFAKILPMWQSTAVRGRLDRARSAGLTTLRANRPPMRLPTCGPHSLGRVTSGRGPPRRLRRPSAGQHPRGVPGGGDPRRRLGGARRASDGRRRGWRVHHDAELPDGRVVAQVPATASAGLGAAARRRGRGLRRHGGERRDQGGLPAGGP